MEIHELNTFSGTPGAGDYLATDNGADTSKISIKAITDPLNERIDNIIGGEAPSAEEIIDARLGADGSVYDTLGGAIRGQVRGIQNTMFHREFNVVDFIKKTGRTYNGVTFTWNDDGSCTLTGTATGQSQVVIFYQTNAFPPFIGGGMPLSVKFESTNSESPVWLDIYKCENGSLTSAWITMPIAYQGDGCFQGYLPSNLSGLYIRLRVDSGSTVNETIRVSIVPQVTMDNYPNAINFASGANGLKRNGMYFVSAGGGTTFEDMPVEGTPFWLQVNCIGDKSSVGVLQIAYPWASASNDVYFRTCQSGVWNEWKQFGSGGGSGGDIYNTYNITTNPHFTTDTNGWLQPIDTDTADETGKTDMTGAIMSLLTDTGYCHLAKGIYYVSGSIDMPRGATLEGCGEDTIIRLLSSVESGYCVKVEKYNTVKGIRFSGGRSAFEPSSSVIGTRNGINFTSNADESATTVEQCVIDNCWFENFSGSAVYCNNTGGAVEKALTMTNSYIQRCTAGINIHYFSEYQKYTNIVVTHCYYACINNGGNNVFTACTFHGTIGFSMDGSRNSAHGSVIGCTFNHIDNWNRPSTRGGGTAILCSNVANGYIFTGCQIWYGAIDIRASRGIALSDCLIGGNSPEISVTGNYPAFFENCIFHATPTLNVNASTKFDNCYLDSDGSVISA